VGCGCAASGEVRLCSARAWPLRPPCSSAGPAQWARPGGSRPATAPRCNDATAQSASSRTTRPGTPAGGGADDQAGPPDGLARLAGPPGPQQGGHDSSPRGRSQAGRAVVWARARAARASSKPSEVRL
jgi:hypothetical protein